MIKATAKEIKKVIAPYYRTEQDFNIMTEAEAEIASDIITSTFSGVYCGIEPTKAGGSMFSVVSLGKTRHIFFRAAIR